MRLRLTRADVDAITFCHAKYAYTQIFESTIYHI